MEKTPRMNRIEQAILRCVNGPKRAFAILGLTLAAMPLPNNQLLIEAAVEYLHKLF